MHIKNNGPLTKEIIDAFAKINEIRVRVFRRTMMRDFLTCPSWIEYMSLNLDGDFRPLNYQPQNHDTLNLLYNSNNGHFYWLSPATSREFYSVGIHLGATIRKMFRERQVRQAGNLRK